MEKSEKWTSTSEASILGEDEFLIAQAATTPEPIPGDAPVTAEGAPAPGDAPAW